MTRITIILHGRHGANTLLRSFLAENEHSTTFQLTVHYTRSQGHAQELALQAATNNDVIIASGGDGTINEVLNGVMIAGNPNLRLVIIPAGTGNDFMRNRPHFQTAEELARCISTGKYSLIDVGYIQSNDQTRYFLNITDAGFGGTVVHSLNRMRRIIKGKIAYPLAILRTFIGFRRPTIELHAGDFHYSGPALLVAFCNGSCFGNGIYIHPGADPTDGKLNITLLGKVSLLDYIRYLPKLKKGIRIQHPELHYLETTACSIKLLSGKMDIEADGEIVSLHDPHFRIMPGAIRYVGPEELSR